MDHAGSSPVRDANKYRDLKFPMYKSRVVRVQVLPGRPIQRFRSFPLCTSEKELSMAKAKKEMADKLRGTTDHELNELVGKKIKEITVFKVNLSPNKGFVRYFYRIKVAGRGENEFFLACPPGSNQEEAKIGLMYPDDFEALIDELVSESHSDLEPDVDDEDDSDLEPDGDEEEEVPANLFDEVESEDDEDDVDDEDEDLEDDDY